MHSPLFDLWILVAFGLAAAYRPRWIPYLTIAGVTLQTDLTRFSSELAVLAGVTAGAAAGAIVRRIRPAFQSVSVTAGLFGLFNLLVVVAYLANARQTDSHQLWVNSRFFVLLSVLIAALIYLSAPQVERKDWLRAFGWMSVVFGAFRLFELLGLPLADWAGRIGLHPLGALSDVGSWNVFALFLAVGVVLALEDAGSPGTPPGRSVRQFGLAVITVIALASAQSRTAGVVFLVSVGILLLMSRSWGRRRALGALVAIFALASLAPGYSLLQKPLLVHSPGVAPRDINLAAAPIVLTPPGMESGRARARSGSPPASLPVLDLDWRSVLDRPYYRLEQTFEASTSPPAYLDLIIGTGRGASGVALSVAFNDADLIEIRPQQVTPEYHWVRIVLPDSVQASSPSRVELRVVGRPDSRINYFLIGGISSYGSGVTTRFWTGSAWITADLSSDPGRQQGLAVILLNGELPPLTRVLASSGPVLDPSIGDRLVLWQTALRIFRDHPIFGTGFYGFGPAQATYNSSSPLFFAYANAHSNYLQLLADLGVAGPLLFISVLLAGLWAMARRARDTDAGWEAVALGVTVIALLLSSVTQTWMADSRIYIPAWILVLAAALPGQAWRR